MNLVYIKVSYDFLDKKFLNKLKSVFGWFRIEAQDVYDIEAQRVVISFYTDKVEIKEGENRQVDLTCKSTEDGDYDIISIDKF